MKRTVLKTIGVVVLAAVVVLGGGILLSHNGVENPVSDAAENATNAAANAALDASGIKGKAEKALRENFALISEKTGLPATVVDSMIDSLDIQGWEVATLPREAVVEDTASVDLDGTTVELTMYDDPSFVTIETEAGPVTLKVPSTAQGYVQYLEYL